MLHESLYHLRETFRDYAKFQAPDILSFCGDALFEDHLVRYIEPKPMVMAEALTSGDLYTSEATEKLYQAILAAAPYLEWQQSYTTDDPGIDKDYLASYGWFNLIAPSGPFVSETIRVAVGYWSKGLTYPVHWHEPEEIYLSVAGSALYISEGREPVRGGPGATICHYSNQPHAAKFDEAPLLAAAFWRGNGLEAKSTIKGDA